MPENGLSASGSNPSESGLPEPGPQDRAGLAKRLLAEEGLANEGPLLGALEALERLGRAAPPAPSGDLAKLLSGSRPVAPAETTQPGGEPGAVVPLVRGRKRRAAASGTLAALVLVAGLGGAAAAASPALRGQLERAISAVVPVAVAPGGVEVDRTQLGSEPSPMPAAPSSPASEPADEPAEEPADGTVAEAPEQAHQQAPEQADDAGADAAGKRPAQDGRGASGDRSAGKRDGSASVGQDNGSRGNGQGGGQDNGKQSSGQDNGNRNNGQGNGGSDERQIPGAWNGVGEGSRGNGWGDIQLPVRGADLWEGLGHTYGRWSEGNSYPGHGGR